MKYLLLNTFINVNLETKRKQFFYNFAADFKCFNFQLCFEGKCNKPGCDLYLTLLRNLHFIAGNLQS